MGNYLSGLVILVIGSCAGVLSGMFGIGGGIVIVPALILVAQFSPQRATGTSLGALLLPVGFLGALKYFQRGDVDVRASALIALGLFLGARLGANIGLSLPPRTLQRGFAVFLVLVAAQMWFRTPPAQRTVAPPAANDSGVHEGK